VGLFLGNNKMLGMAIYNEASQWDGTPIVVIVTGLRGSSNPKTGFDMLQTWILLRDTHPHEALKTGADVSICGNCRHRPLSRRRHRRRHHHRHRVVEITRKRSCYVNIMAPSAIWKSFQSNKYDVVSPDEAGEIIRGRKIRIGSYGDPAMVPVNVWRSLIQHSPLTTGYTHQWREMSPEYAEFCMASVDTAQEAEDATAMGYRTFRCITSDEKLSDKEVLCPASKEAGKLTTCNKCGLCSGSMTERSSSIPTIAITVHGVGAKYFRSVETVENKMV